MPLLRFRPRFALPQLILAGAVIAVIAGTLGITGWGVRTSMAYQRLADRHAREAARHEVNRTAGFTTWSDREARLAEHHARMNQKWEYAASHPWLPVEPDPPEPD